MVILSMVPVSSFGRSRRPSVVPLMPPRAGDDQRVGVGLMSIRDLGAAVTSIEPIETAPDSPWSLGAELGTVGQSVNAGSDVLGLQLLYGGRIFLEIPLLDEILISPGAGFYGRTQGTRAAGVNQYLAELSTGAYYLLNPRETFKYLVGIDIAIEGLFSQLMVFGSSEITPLAYRFRIGPSAGFVYQIDEDFKLHSALRGGVSMGEQNRTYLGVSLGIGYAL